MRATDLFAYAPEVDPEELAASLDAAETDDETELPDLETLDLRVIQIEDHDLSGSAIDAMDSGAIKVIRAAEGRGLESSLVKSEDDYCVRIALIDENKNLEGAIQGAMLADVDLIVIGADVTETEAGRGHHAVLEQAARMGHGVFLLQN